VLNFPFSSESLVDQIFSVAIPHWPLTFSLIGRSHIVHPPLEFELPRQMSEFQTQSEEEKAAREIKALFTK
jgi:hypothetical protein